MATGKPETGSLKRRPEKDLNHDNWDDQDEPEEKGEFQRASEQEIKNRRILVANRKAKGGSSGSAGGAGPSNANPFSSVSFGFGNPAPPRAAAFNFGPSSTFGTGPGTGTAVACDSSGTDDLYKRAGITPSAEPPTKASADSSTADNTEAVAAREAVAVAAREADGPEVLVVSDSEGVEESSNSSSLPWNVSARREDSPSNNAVDSANALGSDNPSWFDDLDEKEASAASSEANGGMQMGRAVAVNDNEKAPQAASSSALADSSESSSSNHQPAFSFGGRPINNPTGSLFRPFQQNNSPSASVRPGNQQSSSVTSPQSSGIGVVRSSVEDDLADYENDTTSSSNKFQNEGNENEINTLEDREAEADILEDSNEDREAEGVDS